MRRTGRESIPRAALLGQPVAELLADVGDRGAGRGEGLVDLLAVVVLRRIGLVPQRRLVTALDVVAADDAVVLAALDPREQLADAPHRHGVGEPQALHLARELVDAAAAGV